jgi:BirA family biotin operon repressor/biotin-[acetyl-CoA-carboxylase] ligase
MKPREEWHLETARLGRRVLVFDQLDSTNTFALGLADDPANEGVVILADEQTSGRGQHGRSWSCPAGSGVLMSVLLFPCPTLRRPAVLTAWTAVSVCELVASAAGLEPAIKWPNDVLVDGRKLCGILIEQTRGAVVGIGLNVNQPAECFVGPLGQGTSLALLTGSQRDTHEVARQLVRIMDAEYVQLTGGNLESLQDRWRLRLGLQGEMVVVETAAGCTRGRLEGLSLDRVGIESSDGSPRSWAPEAVLHLSPSMVSRGPRETINEES